MSVNDTMKEFTNEKLVEVFEKCIGQEKVFGIDPTDIIYSDLQKAFKDEILIRLKSKWIVYKNTQ